MRPASRLLVLAALAAASLIPHAAAAGDANEVLLAGYVHDFDAGAAIGGETDPYGWVLSPDRENREITLRRIAYLRHPGGDAAFLPFAGRSCVVRGVLEKDALSAGGVETPHRTFDVLRVSSIATAKAAHLPGGRLGWRLLADLAERHVEFALHGTPSPRGGLAEDGTIDGRRRAVVVPLDIPPPGSADMYTDIAYVDRRYRRYWAHRSGGFMAVSQWVGPFPLPRRAR